VEDLLNPQVSGSLEEMGLGSSRNPPETPEEVVEEVEAVAEESPAEEPKEEVPEITEEDLVLQLNPPKDSEEQSRIDQLERKLALAEASVEGRLEEIRNQFREKTVPEQPKEEENYFNSPAVQAVLRNIASEDPAQLGQAVATVVAEQVEQKLNKKLESLQQSQEEAQRQAQAMQTVERTKQYLEAQLANEAAQGGIRQKIVEDFYARQDGSALAQAFMAEPSALNTKSGIIGAITSVERELRSRAATQTTPTNSGPSVVETATSGGSSKRALEMSESPDTLSEEEKHLEAILTAGSAADKLGFL
jgi:hypothetical protein